MIRINSIRYVKIVLICFISITTITGSFIAGSHASKIVQMIILTNNQEPGHTIPYSSIHHDSATAFSTNEEQTIHIPILLYHYVENVKDLKDTIRISLNTPPSIFKQQIQTLQDNGYTFITMRYLSNILDGKVPKPEKVVVLTFDDGYEDFYTDVYPILLHEKIPATIYVVFSFIGKKNFMSLSQLNEIVQTELIEIGSHTLTHPNLKGMKKDLQQSEILHSKNFLEELLHISVETFAYPYGGIDDSAIQTVLTSKYNTAVTTVEGNQVSKTNRLLINRIRPGLKTGDSLINHIEKTVEQ